MVREGGLWLFWVYYSHVNICGLFQSQFLCIYWFQLSEFLVGHVMPFLSWRSGVNEFIFTAFGFYMFVCMAPTKAHGLQSKGHTVAHSFLLFLQLWQ